MKRRDFLLTAGTSGLGISALATEAACARETSGNREFVEFRQYTVTDEDKRNRLIGILDHALIPALNKQGIRPVGVLVPDEKEEKYRRNVFVVIPHKNPDSFLSLTRRLLEDETYKKNAAEIFEGTSKDPLYENCESLLLQGFETCPVLETPDLGKNRVFQARLYRSFNIERNAAKIDMFDHGGELALFRKVGLNPIFFGNTVFGAKLPNLTYLVGCESREKHDAAWKAFVSHDDWLKIRDLPKYADTATEIDRVVLRPSPGSQI